MDTLVLSHYQGSSVPHQQLNEARLLEAEGGLAKIESLSVLEAVDVDII